MKTINRAVSRTPTTASTDKVVAKLRAFLSARQLEFLDDPFRFKVLVAGRRGGKSYVDGAYLIINALLKPGTSAIYLGLTRESSKKVIWPILANFLSNVGIAHTVEIANLTVKFPNGSSISVMGADVANMKDRLRGQNFSLAIIDEVGFFSGLQGLMDALIPALADHTGTLAMTSSPGEELTGPFYHAYEGTDKGNWKQFHWDMRSNPFFMVPAKDPSFTTKADEEIATICRLKYGGDLDSPAFVREYFGRYVKDKTYMVYPAVDETTTTLPTTAAKVSLAIALGPDGTFGAVTMEHSEYSRHVNVLNSFVGSFSKTEDVEILRTWYGYSLFRLVDTRDFTDKAVQEISKRFDLAFSPVTLKDVPFFQYLMRQDLVDKYVRVKKDLPILTEWSTIVRDAEGSEKPDADGSPRLMANAALTLYHRIYTVYLKNWSPPPTDEDIMIKQLEDSAKQEQEDLNGDREDVY